jgi:hypothetical protein
MSACYRPPQRVILARILTPTGWLRGSIHLPRLQSLADFLGHATPFLSLTGVSLPGSREELPYLAIRRSAALLILPACEEGSLLLGRDPPDMVAHDVCCVLQSGAIRGRLMLKPTLRVSDYLTRHEGLIVLREADIGPARTRVPVLLLNASALVALAEEPPAPRLDVAAMVHAPAEPARPVVRA